MRCGTLSDEPMPICKSAADSRSFDAYGKMDPFAVVEWHQESTRPLEAPSWLQLSSWNMFFFLKHTHTDSIYDV